MIFLFRKKRKYRFILDVDSTVEPTRGKQEGAEYNGHFKSECFHPIVAFTGEGDGWAGVLRPGNVHSVDGTLDLIKPLVDRYRKRFQLFWFRGDAAFAKPEIYDYCCHKFDANRARFKMGLLAYNLLQLVREFYMVGEEVNRSIEWIIRRMVKVASRVSCHSRYWWVHVVSAFPLRHHYQAVFGLG